jgi:hypothetical protein
MEGYREQLTENIQQQEQAWSKIATAFSHNPCITAVQLDVDQQVDDSSLELMVQALQSLPLLTSLHLRITAKSTSPLPQVARSSEAALQLVAGVVMASGRRLRHVHLESLVVASTAAAQTLASVLPEVPEWTWSHWQCPVLVHEEVIAQAWMRSPWTAWRVRGPLPARWIQAAAQASRAPSLVSISRRLELEGVPVTFPFLQAAHELLSKGGWSLSLRALSLDATTLQTLVSVPALSQLTLSHCCVSTNFDWGELFQIPSLCLTWNRIADEASLVGLLRKVLARPEGAQAYCRRHQIIVHHHWCQDLSHLEACPFPERVSLGAVVQWKGTRWSPALVQLLEFTKLTRDLYDRRNPHPEGWPQHPLGLSVLFAALREGVPLSHPLLAGRRGI